MEGHTVLEGRHTCREIECGLGLRLIGSRGYRMGRTMDWDRWMGPFPGEGLYQRRVYLGISLVSEIIQPVTKRL
jgi:hypothetical protein